MAHLLRVAGGDARRALTALEAGAGAAMATAGDDRPTVLDVQTLETAVDRAALRYDRDGDQHYDVISAFIKSVRGSDVDAALHYLARMVEAGEDPRFIARRLVILASRGHRAGRPDRAARRGRRRRRGGADRHAGGAHQPGAGGDPPDAGTEVERGGPGRRRRAGRRTGRAGGPGAARACATRTTAAPARSGPASATCTRTTSRAGSRRSSTRRTPCCRARTTGPPGTAPRRGWPTSGRSSAPSSAAPDRCEPYRSKILGRGAPLAACLAARASSPRAHQCGTGGGSGPGCHVQTAAWSPLGSAPSADRSVTTCGPRKVATSRLLARYDDEAEVLELLLAGVCRACCAPSCRCPARVVLAGAGRGRRRAGRASARTARGTPLTQPASRPTCGDAPGAASAGRAAASPLMAGRTTCIGGAFGRSAVAAARATATAVHSRGVVEQRGR